MAHFDCVFLLLLSSTIIENAMCLDCYSCNGIADKRSCNQTTTCNLHEYCLLDRNASIFNMRCANTIECSSVNHAATIIGRDIAARQSTACHECCSVDMCNMDLCEHKLPSSCADDEIVDCAKMNSIFNICQDIHKAKLVCPQFCNLCTIVDGHWSLWSNWSTCDVTCGNGTEIRTRTCTYPPPANGGLDCVGQSTEAKSCVLDQCPVHGGWSLWSEWGTCSVTCDIGMQRRDRACNNPYPSRYGDHCFGDSRDDRICVLSGCIDGNWSDWDAWSSCSDSCRGGIKSRKRSCTNPRPSLTGHYCDGNSYETLSCNKDPCPDERISFTSTGISVTGINLIFPNVIHNFGNGYHDKTTGRFTCNVPGTYSISATVSKTYNSFTDVVQCKILINNRGQVGSLQDPYNHDDDRGGYSISMSGIFHLNVNDTVNIGDCSGPETLYNNLYSSFTGFLVTPDNI